MEIIRLVERRTPDRFLNCHLKVYSSKIEVRPNDPNSIITYEYAHGLVLRDYLLLCYQFIAYSDYVLIHFVLCYFTGTKTTI